MRPKNTPLSWLHHWALLLALALYLALATPDLELPGLHYDEALEAATPALLLLQGQPFTVINNGELALGDLRLPLMVQNHIGAVQVYATMPFVALLGPTTLALRAMTVLVGGVTLVAVYAFAAQVYGRTAAGAAALCLAVFPSFVFWSRQGAFVTNLAPCFAACAFAVGARWWTTRRTGLLFLAGLLAGLAVYAKLSALWLVIGVFTWAVLCAVLARNQTGAEPRGVRRSPALRLRFQPLAYRREALAAGAGFFVGVLPVVLYNLVTGFQTFAVVGASASTTYLGTSNLNVLGNLQTRAGQFADVVRSGEHLWYLGGPFPNTLALALFLVALAIILLDLAARRGRGWATSLFMPFLVLACIVQSCFTISALWPTHFAIAVWLTAVVVGVAVGRVTDNGQRTTDNRQQALRLARYTLAIGLFVVIASQINTSRLYLDALRVTGGFSFHSTAIQDVSLFLATRPEPVVALDWGISAPVEYLTNGRKRVEEFYGYTAEPPPNFAAALRERFGGAELYVTHAANQEAFVRRQAFLDAVAAAGLRAETVNVSIRRDGWPMIEVWRVVE